MLNAECRSSVRLAGLRGPLVADTQSLHDIQHCNEIRHRSLPEIALKGRNRPWFVSRLVRNIREATSDLGVREVRALMGRIEVVLGRRRGLGRGAPRLGTVFGAGNFARAGRAPLDVDAIAAEILRDLEPEHRPRSFRVSARRADKRFPADLAADRARGRRPNQGSARLARRSRRRRADDSRRDADQRGVLLFRQASRRRWAAGRGERPGRLPALGRDRFAGGGVADDAARLPGAVRPLPQLSRSSRAPRRRRHASSCALLTEFQYRSRLFLVPFGEIQQRVVLSVAPPLRVVVYRRLMMRIAEAIARRHRAGALVTGEVVGQVASQTIENMTRSTRSRRCRCCGRWSAWTRTRSPPRRSGSGPTRSRSFPIRIAARCSRPSIPRPGRDARRAQAESRARRSTRSSRTRCTRAAVEHFEFPVK